MRKFIIIMQITANYTKATRENRQAFALFGLRVLVNLETGQVCSGFISSSWCFRDKPYNVTFGVGHTHRGDIRSYIILCVCVLVSAISSLIALRTRLSPPHRLAHHSRSLPDMWVWERNVTLGSAAGLEIGK